MSRYFAFTAVILLLTFLSPAGAQAQEDEKLVLVFCYDETTSVLLREMVSFSMDLSSVIEEELGEEYQVIPCTSFSELRQYLQTPNVVTIVTSYLGDGEINTTFPYRPLFQDGMGLLGFNHLCSNELSGDLAIEVFPIFGNASTKGTMTLVNRTWMRLRTYNRSADHPVSEGMPSSFTIPEYELTFCKTPAGRDTWPKPRDGVYTVVFTTTSKDSEYDQGLLPGVVAYENGGRSVSFPGFYGSEKQGVTSYENFVNDPVFVKLVSNGVRWASVSGEERMSRLQPDFAAGLDEFRSVIEEERDEIQRWRKAQSGGRLGLQIAVIVIGAAALSLTLFLTLVSREDESV